jgi:hypothetical protein
LRTSSGTSPRADRPRLALDPEVATAPPESRDPFEALDELMAVIDALCPRWPDRDPVTGPGSFKL